MERSREELDTRLKRQIQFIVEVDKVKNIFRQTYLAVHPEDGKAVIRTNKSKNLQKVPNKIFQSTLCRFLFHFNSSQNFSDRRGNT